MRRSVPYPRDDRFKHLIGKRCVVPFSGGRTVPIIGDDYVDVEFGTGALKARFGPFPRCSFEPRRKYVTSLSHHHIHTVHWYTTFTRRFRASHH